MAEQDSNPIRDIESALCRGATAQRPILGMFLFWLEVASAMQTLGQYEAAAGNRFRAGEPAMTNVAYKATMNEVFGVVRDQQDNYEVIMVCATKELAETIRSLYIQQEVNAFEAMLHDAWTKKFAKVGLISAAPSRRDSEVKRERGELEADVQVVRWPVIYNLGGWKTV